MKNKLILLTSNFPFGKLESYLESEIDVLSSTFTETVILPVEKSGLKRSIPRNAKVGLEINNEFNRTVLRTLRTVLSFDFYKALFDHRKLIKDVNDIIVIFKFISRVLAFIKGIKKIDTENSHVYTYWFNEATYAMLKYRNKFKLNFKVFSRAHRYDLYEGEDKAQEVLRFWPYREYCLKNVDKVFVISESGREFLLKKYGYYRNIFVSRLGVSDKGFLAIGSKDGSITVVSISRVTKLKRVDAIMDSLIKYAADNPILSINWFHIGSGTAFDELLDKSKKVKQDNLKINLLGAIKNEDIYEFYRNKEVDFFISLSSSEGIPVSIMEAQSFGIPVIATDVGATSEIVNENNGVLLNNNPSIKDVVDAIDFIRDTSFNRNSIKNRWNLSYNAKTNYEQFASALIE